MEVVSEPVQVLLLGGFDCVVNGESTPLALGAKRLIALLALHRKGTHRAVAAERLWPSSTPNRAAANTRSALWRGKHVGGQPIIEHRGPRLALSPRVVVDVHATWSRIRDPHRTCWQPAERKKIVAALTQELLPDWSDGWLIYERERWNHLRIQGLEGIVSELQTQGNHLDALETALEAIALEPIRETAHRLIIELHLAEGNKASALRHYQRYRGLLQRELGVTPSTSMDRLIEPLTWA